VSSLDDPLWWSVFQHVYIVRERSRDTGSKLGVLLTRAAVAEGLSARKADSGSQCTSANPCSATVSERGSRTFTTEIAHCLRYGLSSRDSFGLEFPAKQETATVNVEGQQNSVVCLKFTEPIVWPIPDMNLNQPPHTQRFVFGSTSDYLPLDGYSFRLPDVSQPFYAFGEWSDDLATLTVLGPYNRRSVKVGSDTMMGRVSQGVLLRITQPTAPFWVGWVPMSLFILGVLFTLSSTNSRFSFAKEPIPRLFAVIWVLTATLLACRFVVAWRAATLVPLDATSLEKQAFLKTAIVAWWALLIPLAMLAAKSLGAPRHPQLFQSRAEAWLQEFARRTTTTQNLLAPTVTDTSGTLQRTKFIRESSAAPKPGGWLRNFLELLPPGWAFLVMLIPSAWVVLGYFRGHEQSFLGMRINLFVHALTVAASLVVLLSMRYIRSLQGVVIICLMLLPLAIERLLLADQGAVLVFGLSMLPAAAVLAWGSQDTERGFNMGLALALAVVVLGGWWVYSSLDVTARMRLATWQGRMSDVLLAREQPCRGDLTCVDLAWRNEVQRWQTRAFASTGTAPTGYGMAPVSKVGMSYGTSLSDCSFAVFVLAEHGRGVGTFILLAILALAALLSWARSRSRSVGVLVPVYMVAGYFAVASLYMALANVGRVPFTGQNVPFFGLVSYGEVIVAGIMLFIGTYLLFRPETEPARSLTRSLKLPRTVWCLVAVGAVLAVQQFYATLNSLPPPKRDFDFPERSQDPEKDVLRALATQMPDEGKDPSDSRKHWKFEADSDRLVLRNRDNQPSAFEDDAVRQYVERPAKTDPEGGVIYVQHRVIQEGQTRRVQRRIQVNPRYYHLASPFGDKDRIWDGVIVAGTASPLPMLCGVEAPTDVGGHARMASCLTFVHQGNGLRSNNCFASSAASLPAPDEESVLSQPAISFTCDDANQRLEFKLIDSHGAPTIAIAPARADEIYINGTRTDAAELTAGLLANTIVTIRRNRSEKHLIYLGLQSLPLAYTVWRNGVRRRLFAEGLDFPAVYALGQAADQYRDTYRDKVMRLTLDMALQRGLNSTIRDYAARENRGYSSEDPQTAKHLAVTVMDAYRGDVLALPTWPNPDLTGEDVDKQLRTSDPRTQQALLRNFNFANHVVGSTIKPIVFTALATQFWPTLDVGALQFDNVGTMGPNDEHLHNRVGQWTLESNWNCNSSKPTVNADDLLIRSLDFFEGSLGLLGTSLDRLHTFDHAGEPGVLHADAKGEVTYHGSRYTWDPSRLRNLADASVFTLDNLSTRGQPVMKPLSLERMLLLRGLSDLFDSSSVRRGRDQATREKWKADASSFLPGLIPDTDVTGSLIAPEPIDVRPFDKTSPDFLLCVLGGGPSCHFNNVWMAQSAARIATRRKIRAALLVRNALNPTHDFQPLPAPVSNDAWFSEHILNPMQAAYRSGTASDLRNANASCGHPFVLPDGYTGLFKTGTLEDRSDENGGGEESEALLFVIGRFDHGAFVQGRTVAGFIFMEDSKRTRSKGMKKFCFASRVLPVVLSYLRRVEVDSPEARANALSLRRQPVVRRRRRNAQDR
jgi:hypothetical protein